MKVREKEVALRPKKPWFSHDGGSFEGAEPFYFETSGFPWVARIEQHWETIRDELVGLANEHNDSLQPYANTSMISRPKSWKTFGLMFWSIVTRKNCIKAPKTWALLKTIPNITAASFNLLEPGATIKPHNGDTNAIIRCHLGLVVPGTAPQCAFRVGSEIRGWEEGKFLMFCDAHEHTAWNNTNQLRYILVVDVMRPEYAARSRAISARVLASINMQICYQNFEWLRRLFGSERARRMVFALFRLFHNIQLLVWLPASNKLLRS